jgi:hypothetical protein
VVAVSQPSLLHCGVARRVVEHEDDIRAGGIQLIKDLLDDCLDDVTLVTSATAVAGPDERNREQRSVVIEWTRTAACSTRSSDELSDRGGVPLGRLAGFAGVTDPEGGHDARSGGDRRDTTPAPSEFRDQSIPVERKPEAVPRTNEVSSASQGICAAGDQDRVTGEVTKIAKRDE